MSEHDMPSPVAQPEPHYLLATYDESDRLTDICGRCGNDFRHPAHHRVGEVAPSPPVAQHLGGERERLQAFAGLLEDGCDLSDALGAAYHGPIASDRKQWLADRLPALAADLRAILATPSPADSPTGARLDGDGLPTGWRTALEALTEDEADSAYEVGFDCGVQRCIDTLAAIQSAEARDNG